MCRLGSDAAAPLVSAILVGQSRAVSDRVGPCRCARPIASRFSPASAGALCRCAVPVVGRMSPAPVPGGVTSGDGLLPGNAAGKELSE